MVSMHFSVWCFCTCFQVESGHRPFKNNFSVLCSSLVFLVIFPVGFQSQVFWESLLCRIQGFRCLMQSINPWLLREETHNFVIPPGYGSQQLGCGSLPGKNVSLPLLPFLMLSFYPLLWRPCSSSSQISFRENVLYVAMDSLCPWERARSGSSHATVSSYYTYFSCSSFLNCFRDLGRMTKKEGEQS